MKTSKLASLGLIGLAYGSIFVLGAAEAPRGAVASAQDRAAAKQAADAARALGRRDAAAAVDAAERAVALAPQVASYRLLLGQSYMQAGRFGSAGAAFRDVLQLDPGNGKAALNLALMQIAAGDWQAAQGTLAAHADIIPVSDRGLALALAGDPQDAVALLTGVVRSPAATPKARQNLALAYALGGQWQAARVVAAVDMSPADLDQRMQEWAAFAQPAAASDQVASLLGVQPAADRGQPASLALNAPTPSAAPVAVAVAVAAAPVEPVVEAPVAPVASAAPVQQVTQVAFAPRQEVVQPLPAATIPADAGPVRVAAQAGFTGVRAVAFRRAVAPRPVVTGGQWFVQLGAYDSAGVAKDAWGRIKRRHAAFAGHTPQGMTFRTGNATFYRLSLGGFGRAEAVSACRAYRAHGGTCFVRMGAGDQIASWVRPGGTQLAMR